MVNNENSTASGQHRFVFHGKGWPFFKICLTNLILSIITLGIYLPWAFVRSRRYIYEHTELNGVRFGYNASGGVFFVSWLLIGFFMFLGTLVCAMISPALTLLPVLVLTVLMPIMAVRGLRYQALMTTLNEIRFGFNCGSGQALWVMLGLPLIMAILAAALIMLCARMMPDAASVGGLYLQIAVIVLLSLLIIGVANGVIYGKWMQLLGNSASFGIHRFAITVSIKRCIIICIVAMLIMIPFVFVIGSLMSSLLLALSFAASMGGMDETARISLMEQYQGQIIISYLLYIGAIILMSVFTITALRNLFINGLRMGDALTFRSGITFIGLLMQVVVLSVASICTLGLAYPWAKMRLMHYMAKNTYAVGDLDAIELRDAGEKPDTGFFAAIASGTMPALPFI